MSKLDPVVTIRISGVRRLGDGKREVWVTMKMVSGSSSEPMTIRAPSKNLPKLVRRHFENATRVLSPAVKLAVNLVAEQRRGVLHLEAYSATIDRP